ncbi:MAG: methyltransferase regulatory domain-containing protein [Burkholderiales bacterium]
MTQSGASSYDELPYASIAFAQTHPDRLCVIGRLFGMTPALPSGSRVLEIGCAGGGNLLPMAMQMPNAQFVGIDLSPRQIEEGRAVVAQVGATNVDLRVQDLMTVDASLGQFDYIIAHGVFSWIPRAAQEKLLAIFRERLTPQGIAYVSYNTYPGWHMRGMVRDMMVYHAQRFSELSMKVPQARALLDFLADNAASDKGPYGLLLKQEVETLRQSADSYLAHEFLEEHNEPVYFHQFAERAMAQGLQYLGEADFHTMLATNFPKKVADTLAAIAPQIIPLEQYMDFLRNRAFRQSLLVRNDVVLNRSVTWQMVEGFQVSARLAPNGPVDLDPDKAVTFANQRGAGITTSMPISKAALAVLNDAFPATLGVAELRDAARARLPGGLAAATEAVRLQDMETLNSDLLGCFSAGIAELRAEAPPLTTTVSERPQVDAYARFQARQHRPVANRRQELVNIDELGRQVLMLLDGNLDRAALLDALCAIAQTDELQVRKDNTTIRDPEIVRRVLADALPRTYEALARSGLLVA